jgi:peroxiredoxin
MAQRKFNTERLPSSYVIDRTGKVRLMWFGSISEKFLEKYVTDVIKE